MTRVQADEPTGQSSQWSRTFPPEMMAEAAQRLAWLGLIYAVTGLIGRSIPPAALGRPLPKS